MSVKRAFLLLLAFIAGHSLSAQLPKEQARKIDEFANYLLEDWKVPGISLGIVKNDQVVYLKGYGLRDVAAEQPVTPSTIFAIGSSTKAFTGISVLQQMEGGRLQLDAPVIDYLPDFRMHDDYVTQHLTVLDLLCHRSGLPRHDFSWYGSSASREELLERLQYLEPSAGFREEFQYQNLMFMTAGYLVGQVNGTDWEAEVQQRIFEPLGMERANFEVAVMAKDADAAKPYLRKENDEVEPMDYRDISVIGPAGSINASAEEMTAWLLALLNGGSYQGKSIVSPQSIATAQSAAMTVPGAWGSRLGFDNGGAPISYGLGWFLSSHKGQKLVSHGGNIDGFSAEVALLPEDSLGVVVLSNLNGNPAPMILRNYVFDLLTGAEIRDWNGQMLKMWEQQMSMAVQETEDVIRKEGTTPSHELQAYTGTFRHPGYDEVTIFLEGDSLRARVSATPEPLPLGHYHYDVFFNMDELFGETKFQFLTNLDGEVDQLKIQMEPSLPPMALDRQPEAAAQSEDALQAYTGTYMIMDVQPAKVMLSDGKLKVELPGQPLYTLEHQGGEKFAIEGLEGYSVLFQKNAEGEVHKLTFVQPNGQFSGEKQAED